MHTYPPEARPLLRARTQPLPGSGAALPRSRSSSSGRRGTLEQERGSRPAVQEEVRCEGPPQAPPAVAAEASGCDSSPTAGSLAPSSTAGCEPGEPAPAAAAPPLPLVPGSAAGAASATAAEEQGQAGAEEGDWGAGTQQHVMREPTAAGGARTAHEAVYFGPSAADEAAALPGEAAVPAWLVQQGCCNVSVRAGPPCPVESGAAGQ